MSILVSDAPGAVWYHGVGPESAEVSERVNHDACPLGTRPGCCCFTQVDDVVCSNNELGSPFLSFSLCLQALLSCLCGVQAPVSMLPPNSLK